MSEGYKRRGEPFWQSWKAIAIALAVACLLSIMAMLKLRAENRVLEMQSNAHLFMLCESLKENVALNRQLDFLTCRVQEEMPKPIPAPQETPTLIDHPTIEEELDAAQPAMPPGAVGSPAQDLRAEYAGKYHTARKHKLEHQTTCEACGATDHLETHHVLSVSRIFEEGLDHSLIYDPENFVVLCRPDHYEIGHHRNWSTSNPNVRRDAARALKQSKTTLVP